jgi:uncharacterized membrane protein YbhN (UPF0104 family)
VDDVRAFLDASKAFFEAFAAVGWGALGLAVCFHVLRLSLRVRGWQNILRAAYPKARIGYWPVFGSYVAGVGVNALVPARGGDVVKLYLAKHRIKEASYPTLTSTLVVETLFDFFVATGLFLWALQLGLLPGVPDVPSLPAFDWSFVVGHPRLAAFLGSVLLAALLLLAAWASRQVVAFREKVSLGFAALQDRRAFLTGVVSWQALSWLARVGATFFFLRAFHVDATAETTVAVLVVQGLSTMLPFTPGGAGTQQAVLVFALGGAAARSTILAFAFGQQLVVTIVNAALGFGALAVMTRTLRFWDRLRGVDETVKQQDEGDGDGEASDEPAGARSRSALPG